LNGGFEQGLLAEVLAAILLSARDAGEAGLVSASAAALTEGVLHTMLVSNSARPVTEGVHPLIGTSSSRSAECRLADLESKVDRILHALEKDGHEHTERPKSASSYPNAQNPIEQRFNGPKK
jgi:hypothetical protein